MLLIKDIETDLLNINRHKQSFRLILDNVFNENVLNPNVLNRE